MPTSATSSPAATLATIVSRATSLRAQHVVDAAAQQAGFLSLARLAQFVAKSEPYAGASTDVIAIAGSMGAAPHAPLGVPVARTTPRPSYGIATPAAPKPPTPSAPNPAAASLVKPVAASTPAAPLAPAAPAVPILAASGQSASASPAAPATTHAAPTIIDIQAKMAALQAELAALTGSPSSPPSGT